MGFSLTAAAGGATTSAAAVAVAVARATSVTVTVTVKFPAVVNTWTAMAAAWGPTRGLPSPKSNV